MEETTRYRDPEGSLSFRIPAGWVVESDPEEGALEVSGVRSIGSLHLMSFPRPPGEHADPAEELYAFLLDQGIELQEDEVEDLELAGGAELAICEYIAEDDPESGEEPTYWLAAVATAPGRLVFAGYSCPAGQEEADREIVRELLMSLQLSGSPSSADR